MRPLTTPDSQLAHHAETVLFRSMNVKTAMMLFEQAEADILPVVDNSTDRSVVGFLSEAYARRRYIQELDRATAGAAPQPLGL